MAICNKCASTTTADIAPIPYGRRRAAEESALRNATFCRRDRTCLERCLAPPCGSGGPAESSPPAFAHRRCGRKSCHDHRGNVTGLTQCLLQIEEGVGIYLASTKRWRPFGTDHGRGFPNGTASFLKHLGVSPIREMTSDWGWRRKRVSGDEFRNPTALCKSTQ